VDKSLYLINPRSPGASYFGAEVYAEYGFTAAVGIADLASVTVAALAPPDWHVSVCEEHISPINFDHPAMFIGITGKITQAVRMREIAAEFRQRGKTVIIGGPCASLSPGLFRGHCDILITGELESIAAELFSNLQQGRWKSEYAGGRPELCLSPTPRWELYPTDRALSGCVQTSRGCPFECEFCDVIEYLGRSQRTKPIPQILTELDVLYEHGFRTVFLADDNFTVYRQRAKEILSALRDWNHQQASGAVAFNTQVSIESARDPEMLQMLFAAGMNNVFIGIETPNQDSLKETRKRQNVGIDLMAQVGKFLDAGITVTAGMIVGFDHDGPDIFRRQFEFAMASPIAVFSIGALVAPAATPLYTRMRESGRLVEGTEVAASPWDTNIVPARMSREELLQGLRWLCLELYKPANFGQRLLQMIDALPALPTPANTMATVQRAVESEATLIIRRALGQGAEEKDMMNEVLHRTRAKPSVKRQVFRTLFRYVQVRHVYESGKLTGKTVESEYSMT
jgi:hypothetical protein